MEERAILEKGGKDVVKDIILQKDPTNYFW